MEYKNLPKPEFLKQIPKENYLDLLQNIQWIKSVESSFILDENGEICPWYNYAVVNFLKERLLKNMEIFEYGSGFSTIFYAKYAQSVQSSETSCGCFNWLSSCIKILGIQNANLRLVSEENFVGSIGEKCFDVIVIDSIKRNECVKESLKNLKPGGVVILDNSDRDQYQKSFSLMEVFDFKNITFRAIKPNSTKPSSTTIFYKPQNCFNI